MNQSKSPVDSQSTECELYLAAIKIGDPVSRNAFLKRACEGRHNLLTRVERLIAVRERNKSNLRHWAVADSDSPAEDATNPTMTDATPSSASEKAGSTIDITQHPNIGRYKILEEVGRGGMGLHGPPNGTGAPSCCIKNHQSGHEFA